ncbi:MAG: DUF2442 domain-containing protein [Campylobacteraceae bacterium]|nr:DUF2442 domain-containing protein [Campylobacteraceae bacterium]
MFCKITSVKALENYTLLIGFDDGKKCIYNILPLCEKFEVFRDLKTIKGLFEQVKIEPKGYALSWNSSIDISADEIYFGGEVV